MNVLIPIAGQAKRFKDSDHTFSKPLVLIQDKPMIQWVTQNFNSLSPKYAFVVNESDCSEFNFDIMLNQIVDECSVIRQKSLGQGAACSALLAVDQLDMDDELIVCGGDQYLDTDVLAAVEHFRKEKADAGIFYFNSVHPQFSFIKTDSDGYVVEVAEKRPISNKATCGVYWFSKASDFVEGAMDMIRKEDRFNGQFYLCPVFNQLILKHKKILTKEIETSKFYSFGTPEKVREYNISSSLREIKKAIFEK